MNTIDEYTEFQVRDVGDLYFFDRYNKISLDNTMY